ncbi:MAG: c-type cytochrome [Deltaproteobacteria bacterium]|nr:c-type cytochrome [Deltaproteobacteria bacterium]MBI5809937.1 c-type cytochrome [Deltaproteobacteria bacterium]
MKAKDILLFISAAVVIFSGVSFAGPREGKKAFDAGRCGQCHETQGPARGKTIRDQLARKGPELWYAGGKFRAGFIEAWLKDPVPIRPMQYYSLTEKNSGSHPRLSGNEAAEVAAYLMSLTAADASAGTYGIQAVDNKTGRAVFMKKQSCYGCHRVKARGNAAGGLTGPSFIGAALRLNPDWIYAYLANPRAFKPVKDMPNYDGILTDDEMRSVAAYIGSLD